MRSDVQVRDDAAVRWITIHRPESRNGLTVEVVEALTRALAEAAEPEVRALVLTGAGGAFCSGLDLKEAMRTGIQDPEAGMQRFHGLIRALRDLAKPTIAAVDGPAAGFGADLAMACDLRLASARARLGERFVRIGLLPDGGGTWFLPRLVGLGRAFELIYEGRMVEAEEAERIGLVNRVLPVEGFEDAVQEYAARLAAGPPLALAAAKRALLASGGELDASLAIERRSQLELLRSADFAEGVRAFIEKRAPDFRGR